ncbi:hypothetical protein NGM10_01770 [Halorussus salilacus]|uniref:hypothetical protein n=1 Tax=Halorussus salilacus TaxID=2953750 RepID=UPI00209E5E3E|nr:hypothetical protein [Halorussus salilacus]USZ68480.1 hypothetical protein NGM10_01770 [Halorussus salilacus]
MATQQQRMEEPATKEAAQQSTTDPAVLAAVGSVLLAQYQYFMRGNKMMGIFIGLWAPTFLSFASYFNQRRMEEKLSSVGPSRIMNSLEQMLSSR